jgi:hypothetical protein
VLTKGKERTPSATREFKCLLVKEFILYYNNKNIKIFDSSVKGKEEYCGPPQLSNNPICFKRNEKSLFFIISRNVQC